MSIFQGSMRRSRNFCPWGGGGAVVGQNTVLAYFHFTVYRWGVQWFDYRENYIFPRIRRGSNFFQGRGGGGGGGGPNANFYRNPYI